MKKIKFLAIVLAIGTSSLFANEVVPDIPVKEIRTQIAELFDAPEFVLKNDVTVTVYFTFDSEGNIDVKRIDSFNKRIHRYILKEMNHKKIENIGEVDKLFKIDLRFKENF